jgi:hypothetical protein
MEEWQLRQKHYENVRRILAENGATDSNGWIRKWDGPVIVPALEAAGHTSLGFTNCVCARAKKEGG